MALGYTAGGWELGGGWGGGVDMFGSVLPAAETGSWPWCRSSV